MAELKSSLLPSHRSDDPHPGRLVGISLVRNEGDIIEAFVRYNCLYLDELLIFDHGSTDATPDILAKLLAEGLPIRLSQDASVGYRRPELMNSLLSTAIEHHDPQFILPLDADEFLRASHQNHDVSHLIRGLPQDKITYVPWMTYIPTPQDQADDPLVLSRVRHRAQHEHYQYFKVIIPSALARAHRIRIAEGNHDVAYDGGERLASFHTKYVKIAHFPLRSVEQATLKFALGWLSHLAVPERDDSLHFHWRQAFSLLRETGHLSPEQLTEIALTYGAPPSSQPQESPLASDVTFDPVRVPARMSLKYTPRQMDPPLKHILRYAEKLTEAIRTQSQAPRD